MADNHLAMSDEDFLKQPLPETEEVSSETSSSENNSEAKTQEEPAKEEIPAQQETTPVEEQKPEDKQIEPEKKDESLPSGSKEGEANPEVKSGDKPAEGQAEGEAKNEKDQAKPEENQEQAPDYKSFYEKIMAPFTANGKKIELKDPAEAVQLMQMGANYTRKLQELAPHRKILAMLGNNQLLDEGKLSFLIDLDKGDPEAIKKLIKDKGMDPLDIDTNIEPAYQGGSHAVSDQEVAFRTQLEDLSSTDTGKQTLHEVNDKWDQASKDMLFQSPEVLSIIHSQRETGIYSKITDEMDRQRTLGQLSATTPFLEAYKTVGDQLQAAGVFNNLGQSNATTEQSNITTGASAAKPTPEVVTTRAATPKPIVDNGDRAGAASPSRSAPGTAKEVKNFLAMSDEDFLKSEALGGRV